MTALRNLSQLSPPFKAIVAAEIIVIFVGAAFVLPGGSDLRRFYRPIAEGCVACGFSPYFASWLLFPLSLPPENWLWPIWSLLTSVVVVILSRRFRTEPVFVFLTFPFVGMIWLGQIDMLILLGLWLGLRASNPYLRGFGLLLMSLKPQVAGPAALLLLWSERQRIRALIIPVSVFALSLLYWGIDWPLRWFSHQPALDPWRQAALFPVGLLAFLSLPRLASGAERVRATLLATALALPQYGVYSYSVPLVMSTPWWSVPLSYAWVSAYPWLGADALRFAWVLPLALLAHQMWSQQAQGGLRDWHEILSLRRTPSVRAPK